jgi:spermidine synthase
LQSVVKTFANNFQYVYVWLTDYDAELIGSNEPIEIDIAALQQRIEASPEVLSDLQRVHMGSAVQLLSYGIMGPAASRAYGKNAPLNTDNNLYLEFSAPASKGKGELIAINIEDLSRHREDLSPYLSGKSLHAALGTDQPALRRAAALYDQAHQLHYQGKDRHPVYQSLMRTMENEFPWYAPGQFLRAEYQDFRSRIPQLVHEIKLNLINDQGAQVLVVLSAVSIKINEERSKLVIVDNQTRKIYGSVYIDGQADEIDQLVARTSERLLRRIDTAYQQERTTKAYPEARPTLKKIEAALN